MGTPLVHVSSSDGITRIELDKPPVNAFDLSLVLELAAAVHEAERSNARVVVFSGRGASFAAGGDIKWMHERMRERDAKSLRTFLRAIQRAFDDVDRLPMPTIAAIHGPTLGGGLELALACDLRIASDDTRIGFPEATIGLIPAAGGTQRLTEAVGRARAVELMCTGATLDAQQANALGLVNRVVPAAELQQATEDFVAEVLRATPGAAAAVKDCIRTRVENGRDAGFRREGELIEALAFDPDAYERLEAFVERRATPPREAATETRSEGA